MTLLLLLVGQASEPPRGWWAVNEARLALVSEGSPALAAQYCDAALAELGPESLERGEVLYTLGKTRWELGDTEGAREALNEAARDPRVGSAARALLLHIELETSAVDRLPWSCGFEGGLCGFRRSWLTPDAPNLQVRPADGDPALAWDLEVKGVTWERIALAFVEGLPVRSFSLRARAEAFPVVVRFTVLDGAGGRYSTSPIELPDDEWLPLDLPLSAFENQDPTAPSRYPRRARVLEIEDVTGAVLAYRGVNTLWLSDVAVR